ncbi:hypothetical protein GQX74_010966 [Glossina fuscipes]|nr:hypothetical protein GQX74_010966 [Glossina fuscipes]
MEGGSKSQPKIRDKSLPVPKGTLAVLFALCLWTKVTVTLNNRCQHLLKGSLTFICNNTYPEEAKKSYSDGLVYVNLSYSVYKINGRHNAYFITHGKSSISACRTLIVKDDEVFECDGKSVWIIGTKPRTYCLPFAFRLTDLLIERCASEPWPVASETAMHYFSPASSIFDFILTANS